MAITFLGKKNGMIVLKGKLVEDGDEANRLCEAMTTPAGRVAAVSRMALLYFRSKGVDLNARRLARSIRIVRKEWRS